MANKNLVVVLALVAGGLIVLFLAFKQNAPSSNQVVMQEVFAQKPASDPALEKDPVTSPAIVTSPELGREAGFAVQVYSFKDQGKAEVALSNLKAQGYKAYIEISDLGEKGTWYRVRIGQLSNEAEAKAMLETIRKSFNSGIIVKG
jgi:cell division protein FtsN